MSIGLVALVRDCALPRHLRHIVLVLASYANPDGQNIFPRVATLAKALGGPDRPLHKTSVIRLLRELKALGVLEVVEARKGQRRAVLYRLVPGALTGSTPATREAGQVAAGLPVDGNGLHGCYPTGSTSATHKANRNYQDKGEGHDGESLSVRVARRDDAARDALAIAALRSDEEEEEV